MKILLVGNGGREHALAWALGRSPDVDEIWCTRPNAGLALLVRAVDLAPSDIAGLRALAVTERFDLTVVGPELPLTLGIVDAFEAEGLTIFGPSAAAARLEGSKAFAKEIMALSGIPTAAFATFTALDAAKAWVREFGRPVAVKADGLAAGKGVFLCQTVAEADAALDALLVGGAMGAAGARVVIEELLIGEEASFIGISDGRTVRALASSQDHKQVGDGDTGPMTGGMGAYSPAPIVTDALANEVLKTVMQPTVDAMAERGAPFVGFLYAGLMVTAMGPKVLEFNVRLGDPETQPLMMRLESDLAALLLGTLNGGLASLDIRWRDDVALGVVLAAPGYPASATVDAPISGLGAASKLPGVMVFHAGTRTGPDGQAVTSGGRVLCVTALGESTADAAKKAYAAADLIQWPGQHRRSDIGWRAMGPTAE